MLQYNIYIELFQAEQVTCNAFRKKTFKRATTGTIIETRALRILGTEAASPHTVTTVDCTHMNQREQSSPKAFYRVTIKAQHRTSTGLGFKKDSPVFCI